MDPLSISASIAGLVTLADLVFRSVSKYARSVRGCLNEVEALLLEIKSLSVLLHELSLVAFDLEADSAEPQETSTDSRNFRLHHLHTCQHDLQELDNGLRDSQSLMISKTPLDRLQSRAKWPFSSAATKEAIQKVQRHKKILDSAIAVESLTKLKQCLTRQEDTKSSLRDLQTSVNNILDIQSQIRHDKRKQKVVNFFLSVDPRDEYETNIGSRHPMTGLWLTEGHDFDEWYTTPGASVWCSGIPGGGKSVLAACVTEETLRRSVEDPTSAVAYFFCTYRNPETHKPATLLSSLCAQLALRSDEAFQVLENYYNELRPDVRVPKEPSAKQLANTLRKLSALFHRVYLIIDGLDECSQNMQDIACIFSGLNDASSATPINMALFSRDEVTIRYEIGHLFHHVEIAAHTEDLQLYVAAELDNRIASRKLKFRDATLKQLLLTRLVAGAHGMFRWVTCQLDHLCALFTDKERKDALDKLPPTLYDTYERLLVQIDGSGAEARALVQKTLVSLASPTNYDLTLSQLCEMLSLSEASERLDDDEIIPEEVVLRLCSSLVRVAPRPNKQVGLEFAHFTVQEYLGNVCPNHPTLKGYSVTRERACGFLGVRCLWYLALDNRAQLPTATVEEVEMIKHRAISNPLYEHAAIRWQWYRRETGCDRPTFHDAFDGAILRLFGKRPNYLSWVVELLRHCLVRPGGGFSFHPRSDFGSSRETALTLISAINRPDFTPLHIAAAMGLPTVCQTLLERGADANICSRFGTPLHCAIGAFTVFTDADVEQHWSTSGELRPKAFRHQRRETLRLLLGAGASPRLQLHTPFKYAPLLSLVVVSSRYEDELEMTSDLIHAGVEVVTEDLSYFQSFYDHALQCFQPEEFKRRSNDGRAFLSLMDALEIKPSDDIEASARQILITKTRTFIKEMDLGQAQSLAEAQDEWSDSVSDESVIACIRQYIAFNSVQSLQDFLQSSRADLIHGSLEDDWSALHIAVRENSLSAFHALLKFGLDIEKKLEDGRSPIHLCWYNHDEDFVRVLLEQGAKTCSADEEGCTIWHYAASGGSDRVLKALCDSASAERSEALCMINKEGRTPICEALGSDNEQAVLMLLQHCNTTDCWKSDQSIFQAAASMEDPNIVRTIIETGVVDDGIDRKAETSPLHWLSERASLESIELLKPRYSLTQRRNSDNLTPVEVLISRSVGYRDPLSSDVVRAMIPKEAYVDPTEASKLWTFACKSILKFALDQRDGYMWLSRILGTLVECGIPRLLHQTRAGSHLLAFIRPVTGLEGSVIHFVKEYRIPPEKLPAWAKFSKLVLTISEDIVDWSPFINEASLSRLLALAVLHADEDLVKLLLDGGIDILSDTDGWTPFHLACFPEIAMSKSLFNHLVGEALVQKHTRNSADNLDPLLLRLVAGFRDTRAPTYKLESLLANNIDLDAPISDSTLTATPLACILITGPIHFAEALLDHGADPWANGPQNTNIDAVAAAAFGGHIEILQRIFSMTPSDEADTRWSRRWTGVLRGLQFNGANALHLAARAGHVDCVRFFCGTNMPVTLDIEDNERRTPLHHAVVGGHTEIIKILVRSGCHIDASDAKVLTPLHVAVIQNQIKAVEALVLLGAKQKLCSAGCSPLSYAYASKNADALVKALQLSDESCNSTSAITDPRVLRVLARRLRMAIQQNDLEACKTIHAIGCPVDVEFVLHNDPTLYTTALGFAIHQGCASDMIRWFIDTGADAKIFSTSSRHDYVDELEIFIKRSHASEILPDLTRRYFDHKATALSSLHFPLFTAAHIGHRQGLRCFLDTGYQVYRSRHALKDWIRSINGTHSGCCGQTALKIAASRGDVMSLHALVEHGASIHLCENGNHNTALHFAAHQGHKQTVEALLNFGASPELRNASGQTPLAIAVGAGFEEISSLLLKASKSESITRWLRQGKSLLHLACTTKPVVRLGTIQKLLEKGLDLYQADVYGVCPVHYLLFHSSKHALRILLDSNPQQVDFIKMPPWPQNLHEVVAFPLEILANITRILCFYRRLLKHEEMLHLMGFDNDGDHTIMCWAAVLGSLEAVQTLARLEPKLITNRCCQHGTPLESALSVFTYQHDKTARYIIHVLQVQGIGSLTEVLRSPAALVADFVQWHSSRRYMQNLLISDDALPESQQQIEVWSGVWSAEIPVRWEWKRMCQESMLEYAGRRQHIITSLNGESHITTRLVAPRQKSVR